MDGHTGESRAEGESRERHIHTPATSTPRTYTHLPCGPEHLIAALHRDERVMQHLDQILGVCAWERERGRERASFVVRIREREREMLRPAEARQGKRASERENQRGRENERGGARERKRETERGGWGRERE